MARLEYDWDSAAEYLGTSPRHVQRLWAERRLSGHKIGRFVRFTQGDLDAYAEAHRLEALR
jgi:excisionase family DNA binding protein